MIRVEIVLNILYYGQGGKGVENKDSHFGIRRFMFMGVKGCFQIDLNSVEMLDILFLNIVRFTLNVKIR